MLSSAMGRAWLAHASAAQRCAVLNQLRVRDPASYARYAPDIEQARQDLARKAYCPSRGDVRKDVYPFAVPFSRPVDGLQLVMHCGVLAARFSFAQAERQVAQPLCELVRQVEAALGLRAAQRSPPGIGAFNILKQRWPARARAAHPGRSPITCRRHARPLTARPSAAPPCA